MSKRSDLELVKDWQTIRTEFEAMERMSCVPASLRASARSGLTTSSMRRGLSAGTAKWWRRTMPTIRQRWRG